jgi:hypothetical protein
MQGSGKTLTLKCPQKVMKEETRLNVICAKGYELK